MEHFMNKIDMRETPAVIADSGKLRIGDVSPSFPPARGKAANASDSGKVRVGDMSPSLPPLRSR